MVNPDYTSTEIYELEKRKVFDRSWLFLGHKSQAPSKNDYFLWEFLEYSLIVWNSGSEFKAYWNICPHRQSTLVDSCGSGAVVCPYHGLAFNAEGESICRVTDRRFGGIDTSLLKLRSVEVASCGNFLFMAGEDCSETLENFLEGSWDHVDALSREMGTHVATISRTRDYNWKIAVENVLEVLHVNTVHSNTFSSVFENNLDADFIFANRHSRANFKIRNDYKSTLNNLVGGFIKPNGFSEYDYLHQHIFPNTMLISQSGAMMLTETYNPLSSSKVTYNLNFFLPVSTDLSKKSRIKGFVKLMEDYTNEVLDEDDEIRLKVQRGCSISKDRPVFADCEGRILGFHKALARYLL